MTTMHRRIYYCVYCGQPCHDDYMLRHSIWLEELGLKKTDNAHLDCVIKKLGRPLEINEFHPQSLINRLVITAIRNGMNLVYENIKRTME